MSNRRTILLGFALLTLQASFAVAQSASPWTGIAADEARPATTTFYSPGDNEMMWRSMSGDGRFVVFHSSMSHLVYGDTNNATDVFLRDRQTGELRRVSVASDGAQGDSVSAFATISRNGRHIAFWSCASNFDPADTNNLCDLFIHDRELGTTVVANLGPNGEQATFTAQHYFSLSADGRYFTFTASFGGSWNDRQVFLRDRDTDENGVFDEPGTATTTQISQQVVGINELWGFEEVAISGDGRWIAYNASTHSNGNFAGYRLYVHDRVTGNASRVDLAMAGGVDIPAYSGNPDFSDNGLLAYTSNADNLAEGDTDGKEDIFVFNLWTGGNLPVELSHPGAPALELEWSPAISADGRYLAFTGVSLGEWSSEVSNVYVVDRQTGLSYEISVRPDGTRDDDAGAPSISADGAAIAFDAGPWMLLNGCCQQGVFVATGVDLSPPTIDVPGQGGTFTIDVTMPAGIGWTLNTQGAQGVEFSQTSGLGPASIDVTLWENNSGQPQDFYVLLGSEQVVLHQSVQPHVYGVWPYDGGPEGGTEIDIYGFAFVEGATVTIGGVPATNVVVLDAYNMSATTPPHALGWVDVTVTNPDGASFTREYGFWYRDVTPPVVAYEIGGTPGTNGWYTSDVWVNWNWEDPESQTFINGCVNPYVQTTDIESNTVICAIYSDGGETIGEFEIKRDTLPPVIAIAPSEPATYFQGEVVPLAHYCSDQTSGIASCTPNQAGPNLDTSAVGTFEFSVTAVDMAGHSTTRSTSYTVKMATTITMQEATTTYGVSAALRATLLGSGAPLAGKALTFYFDGAVAGTAITAANGEAVLNLSEGNNAGTYGLWARFEGDDSALASMSNGVNLIVEKATPVVTWPTPAPIVHGTPLSTTQLNATASVPGVYGYSPDEGTVLAPGTHTLTVEFQGNPVNYNIVSKTVTLKVKAIPVITWATPAPKTYPAFSTSALNATANVPGTFVYTPPAGTLLDAGTHTLSVTFTPTNQADYTTATASVEIEVLKGTVTLSWVVEISPYYSQPLGANQLNATANTSGTFAYDPPAGTLLPTGPHTISVVFTPANPSYNTATKSIPLTVYKHPTTVVWDFPAAMQWGPLGPAQQNATASVPGTFSYSPPPGTILEIGQHWMSVVFTPTDSTNYDTDGTYVSITVVSAPTTVNWSNPAPITYPQSLQDLQLNATASAPGTFTYTPPWGTVLPAGTHTLHVSFSPTDSVHYNGSGKDVTIVVAKRTPTITWSNPVGISYGTALSAAQLNATSNAAGTFSYSPALGTLLPVGTHTLSVTFTPNDPANNLPATANTTISVAAATPAVSWSVPAGIVYGTPLSSSQLNATANVAGTFEYSPGVGTVLGAGTHQLSVTFTPTDSSNYTGGGGTVSIVVAKAAPVVTWSNPAGITYGTALSSSELNATANLPGTFEYSPAGGTLLGSGTHQLSVTFTPSDSANYASATANATVVVGKAAPVVTWANPASITYLVPVSPAQLNATANVPGTFAYSPADGTVLSAGTHQLSVTFTPTSANYATATANVPLVVEKRTAIVTWGNPGGLVYGTALSSAQLNASAFYPGTFTYSPAAGSVLNVGTHQLSATYTPADTANFNVVIKTVPIEVVKALPVITWAAPAGISYGAALSAAQLNATANVPGSFSYTPAAGAVINAGTQFLYVTFTPDDTANYHSPTTNRPITVAKIPLTVRANNASKVYGEALPAFTATGIGFVNGDSLSSLNGTLTFSATATAWSVPGTYTVMPNTGLSSANYNISYANGTLTVDKASTSVAMTTTPNPSNNNQVVQLRAVVAAVAPGAGTPAGTVEFREGSTLLGSATLVDGVATINKNFKKGTHPLTATYVGSANFNPSAGGVTHQVP